MTNFQSYYIYIPSLVISFLLGVYLLANNKKDEKNIIFSLITLSAFLWILVLLISDSLTDINAVFFWSQVAIIPPSFIPPLLVYFSFIFPKKRFDISLFTKILLFLPPILFSILAFTSINVQSVVHKSWGTEVSSGPLYIILVSYFLAFVVISIYNFIKSYRTLSEKIYKSQILYVVIGLFVAILVSLLTNAIFVLFGNSQFSAIGTASFLILLGLTVYAIVKKQLFEIRVITTEALVVLIIIGLLIDTFLSKTAPELILKILLLGLSSYGGYLLIKSVQEEIRKKEKLQELTMQLGQANAHLQELDKMKTEFVSLASHELLTPVSAIEGYLSMLLDEHLAKVDDPKAVKYLDNVYKSAKRLARLVTDMLNVSRIEEGRLLVEKKDVNLTEIVSQVVDELKFKAEEGHQKIEFANPDGWNTFGDADKIKEVIINIIGNSIKYSKEPGTITINITKVPTTQVSETWAKIEAEIKARPLDDQEAIKSAVDEHLRGLVGDEQLLISVKDNGIGIPKDELPRLFKKFHRVGDYTTAESQGTGLGLYISRALVELNHGRIWADSEGQGKGSTFSFSLPLLEHKKEIQDLEAQAPKTGEQLKPLAHPTKEAEEM